MSDNIKLLRYNTGNDKKAFVEFKDAFDAVIFNATIVAYRYLLSPPLNMKKKFFSSQPKGEMI